MDRIEHVDGVIFDLDGVVHVGDTAIPGAAKALSALKTRGIPFCFLTNTTTRSPQQLHDHVRRLQLPVENGHILTTHEVAVDYLRGIGSPRCWVLVADDSREAYREFRQTETEPECIVIGDIGDRWSYPLINRVFNRVMDGAQLIALHKGRFWRAADGLRMDIGCFVTGLEFTTGTRAVVLGKPARPFFELGLRRLGMPADRAIMVGDDIESDVGGAQAAGIRGVLVRTGKFRPDTIVSSSVQPYAVIDSIASLPDLIG